MMLPLAFLNPQIETRHFILHKFMQNIGEESDTIAIQDGIRRTTVTFKFTDRGNAVPLQANLQTSLDDHPISMELKGFVARGSAVDLKVDIKDLTANIVADKVLRTEKIASDTCAVSGYSPVVFQENLIRTWLARGKPSSLSIVPAGKVEIRQSAIDKLNLNGKAVSLKRYSVRGLIWGLETVWTDSHDHLVGLACRDAEFDHFEATADEYEPLLSQFAGLAGQDSMQELARISQGATTKTAPIVALVGGRLFDGENVTENAVVVMSGDKIVAAGPRATTQIPPHSEIIDVTGKTILPGLWDMHAHFEQAEWGPTYLAAGVTTVRDCGNVFEFITGVRDAIRDGKGIGPRLVLAGLVDGDGKGALGINRVNNPEDAKAQVKRYHDAGFAQMKIYSSMKVANVRAVCEEAHKFGMTVTGHIPNGMTIKDGIEAGMDQVNHVQYLVPYLGINSLAPPKTQAEGIAQVLAFNPDLADVKEKLAYLKAHGTVFDPTVALFELEMHDSANKSPFEPGLTKLPAELRAGLMGMAAGGNKDTAAIFAVMLKMIGAVHRAGIPIIAGTDQAIPGHSLHRELELYVQAGFTPKEAIQAACVVPARVMGMQNETGSIRPGLSADVIVVEGNPLERISDSRNVRMVFAKGRLFDPAKLWKIVGFVP